MSNDLPLHRPAIYNPGLWSRDEVKTYYVARQPLLARLLDDLRRERPDSRPQHRLILGLRGMGKSTLLRRFAVAVEDDFELAAQWLPLTFPEEQYNVGSLADLWLNCLDALGDLLAGRGQNAEVTKIDAMVAGLARRDHESALQALIQIAKRLDRRLLLLFDNIDLILDRLKDSHWVLREALQSQPEILVVGTSARALEASYQYGAAFYDFFKPDELRGLSEREMYDTLLTLARFRGVPEVERRIEAEPSRIRILHTLTGGNPRTMVLLYGVLLKGMDSDMRADLEGLLDEITPLYKARFEELPAQGQQLLDKLALHWDPMTARQLADALIWDVNLVSAQLNRLTQLGIVEKVKSGSGKRAVFQVGERFFNMWYLMRASRRVRRKLVWLVEFLCAWYSSEELRSHARVRLNQGTASELDVEYYFALSSALKNEPLAHSLKTQALYTLVRKDMHTALEEILDLHGEDRLLLSMVERIKELEKLRKSVEQALENLEVNFDKQIFIERLLGSVALINLRPSLLNDIAKAKLSATQWQNLDTQLQKEWDDLHRLYGNSADMLYQAVACGEMGGLDDQEGAKAAADRFNNPMLALLPRLQDAYEGKIDPEQAEQIIHQALEFEPKAAGLWHRLGYLLEVSLKKKIDAELAYYRAIELDPKFAAPWNNLAWLYYDKDDHNKMLDTARKSIDLARHFNRQDKHILSYVLHTAATMQFVAGDTEEALSNCRDLFQLADDEFFTLASSEDFLLFHKGLKEGTSELLLKILDESNKGRERERWRPLREALAAAVAGKPEILLDVAPEVRKPALEILARIAPDLPISADLR